MESDGVIAEILRELELTQEKLKHTEHELQQKNQELVELKGPPLPSLGKSHSDATVKPGGSLRSFETNDLRFFVREENDVETIEFSCSGREGPASLIKKRSSNSLLLHSLEEISRLVRETEDVKQHMEAAVKTLQGEMQAKTRTLQDTAAETIEEKSEIARKLLKEVSGDLQDSHLTEKKTERVYVIQQVLTDTLAMKLGQLVDKNGIALTELRLVTKPFSFLDSTDLLPKAEFSGLAESLQHNGILINYQLTELDNQKVFCPVTIKPQGLPVQEYNIKFSNTENRISGVLHKSDGPVKFTALEISQECGLVQNSLVELFTCPLPPHTLNILHMHINDTQEQVTIDTVCLLEDQTFEDYNEWPEDSRGCPLRYKVLVKDCKVHSVLYNTGNSTETLSFIERRFNEGDLVRIADSLCRVSLVPTGMLARHWESQEIPGVMSMKAPRALCSKRHLEELPGFLDLQIVMENSQFTRNGEQFSVPVCECEELPESEQNQYKSMLALLLNSTQQQFEQNVLQLGKLVHQFASGNTEDSQLYFLLSKKSTEVKNYLEDNRKYVKNYTALLQQAEKALRILAARTKH